MTNEKRDWDDLIQRLNTSKSGRISVRMGSPGSAQVTRCRLLARWRNLNARTHGPLLVLELQQP